MTPSATFITNGVEREVVNQHRSPGVFFDHDKGKHMQAVSFYLIVELYQAEDHG